MEVKKNEKHAVSKRRSITKKLPGNRCYGVEIRLKTTGLNYSLN
jgi:hypothetical protein